MLGALVATRQHHHEHRAMLLEVHPITGSVVDPQLADAATYRLDVAKVSVGDAVESRRDPCPGANIAQAAEPGIERCGFDQFEHRRSVNCGCHSIKPARAVAHSASQVDVRLINEAVRNVLVGVRKVDIGVRNFLVEVGNLHVEVRKVHAEVGRVPVGVGKLSLDLPYVLANVPNLPAVVQNVSVDMADVCVEVLHITVGVADPPDLVAQGAHEDLLVEACGHAELGRQPRGPSGACCLP